MFPELMTFHRDMILNSQLGAEGSNALPTRLYIFNVGFFFLGGKGPELCARALEGSWRSALRVCLLLFEGLPAEAAGERDSPPGRPDPPCGSLQEKGRRKETGSEHRDGRLASEGHGNKNTARHVPFPRGPPMHSRSGCSICRHVQTRQLVLKFSLTWFLQWLQCGCSCQSAVCGEICRLPSRCVACCGVCAPSPCHSQCDAVIMLSGQDMRLISRQARSVTPAHHSSASSENPSGGVLMIYHQRLNFLLRNV